MAAVLCRGVGQLCKGLGEVVCLPCKACGIGCEAIWNAVKSPFLPYLLVTIGLNLPPVSMGVRSIPELFVGEEGCSEEGPLWLIVNMALATIHILAAFYLSRKISQEEDYASSVNATTTNTTASNAPTPVMATMTTTTTPTPVPQASAVVYGETTESKIETGMSDKLEVSATAPVEEPTTPSSNSNKTSTPKVAQTQPKNKNNNLTGTPHNTMSRVRHMLCEDKWMALYILIGIGWILWQIIGVQRFFALDDAEDACSNVRGFIATSLACGWLYFFLAGIAFGISLCCLGLSS